MPSTPSYDLVRDDQDIRVPLHAEQSFFHGIKFQAKFIGWQEVPRPNSRTEIVQAMRRIRYECKVQNMKKRKVTIEISVDGVKVCLKKKKRKKKQWQCDPEIELLNHPIYRIFYVSHDSSDLKIFSYIARDGSTDTFKCSVFKSNKKSQAMRIVRTVGQAFEVCHKISVQKNSSDNNDDHSETPCDTSEPDRCSDQISNDDEPKKEPISVTPEPQITRPNHLEILSHVNYNNARKSPNIGVGNVGIIDAESADNKTQNNTSREIQQLRDQLEQQTLQTRQALGQLMLVREQLITETNARIEAQARTQQLLQQNRELLEHIASMGGYHEPDRPGLTAATIGMAPQSPLPVYFSDPDSPLRKTFGQGTLGTGAGPTNNNINALNQQLSNLGSINQQLTNLSQQLNSLNQQNQNLQNYQQIPNCTISMNNKCLSGNNIQNTQQQQQQQDIIKQQELFQLNQELLNRLQNLNFGFTNSNNNNNFNNINQNSNNSNNNNNNINNSNNYNNNNNNSNIKNSNNNLIQNSFPFSNGTNDGSTSALLTSGNNNNNLLSSPSSIGNLTPSPLSTLNRSSYSASPLDESFRLSTEKNLNNADNLSHFIKPLSHVGTLTTLDTDGKVKVIVPVTNAISSPSTPQLDKNNKIINNNGDNDNQQRQQQQQQPNSTIKRTDKRVTLPSMVTLKITDESGNIMNTKKISATPSIITRSTSEKVPNRSQIMSQVQRTAWARHTTK